MVGQWHGKARRATRAWRRGGEAGGSAEPGRPYPGWFIAVEGGDGAGKSTQIAAIAAWLRRRGFEVVTTREPGATQLGVALRDLVLHAREYRLGARAEALLFAADRADHMETLVRPALEAGAIVLTDRHVDSSVAYQSGGRGLPADEVAGLSAFAVNGVRPDLVILLDLDPAVARDRREERTGMPDKLEAEAGDFHERVRAAFLARADADPPRYLVVDADQSPKILTGAIQDRLEGLLPPSPKEAAAAARREAERLDALRKEEEFRTAQVAAEQAAREALERELRERATREMAERQAAEQERSRRIAAENAAREAEERDRLEQEEAAERERAESAKRSAERREQERRIQLQEDTHRRREAELIVRQAEARAKERARQEHAATREVQEKSRREARERARAAAAAAAAAAARPSLTDELMSFGDVPAPWTPPTEPGGAGEPGEKRDPTLELPKTPDESGSTLELPKTVAEQGSETEPATETAAEPATGTAAEAAASEESTAEPAVEEPAAEQSTAEEPAAEEPAESAETSRESS